MNEYDSNRISHLIEKIGYKKTEILENTDCYILNTCHISGIKMIELKILLVSSCDIKSFQSYV